MAWLDVLGYDQAGTVTEIETTLDRGRLSTLGVASAALAYNAPAWVAASSMSVLYVVAGHAAPLSILVAYVFPMLILGACLTRLIRAAPSAAGVFTFVERFLHPAMGTVLGWTYAVNAMVVGPLTAVLGAEYLQALFPVLGGDLAARALSSLLIVLFVGVCLGGIKLTEKVASVLLAFEILVVAGLGLCGIVAPQVPDLPLGALYGIHGQSGLLAVAQGVLFGVWMLANFDSSINFIEEARVPVRTVQRAMFMVLTAALVIYSLAAIGWQYAVPIAQLGKSVENGNGGPIAAVAQVYLPRSAAWVALFVVITSSCAGLQSALNAGSRTLYRMSREGHLPAALSRINQNKSPSVALMAMGGVGVVMVWLRPLANLTWYFDTCAITLVMVYVAMCAAAIRLLFRSHSKGVACALAILPLLSIVVLLYVGYTAGADPVDLADLFNAWYMGAAVAASGVLLVLFGARYHRALPYPRPHADG